MNPGPNQSGPENSQPKETQAEVQLGPISLFQAVVVAALRVKQLRRGSKPRIELDDKKHKVTRIATEEVIRGLISFTQSALPHVHAPNGMEGSKGASTNRVLTSNHHEAAGSFETDEAVMNELKIFTRPETGPVEDNVFYSQRSHGPMYRWQYETQLARWNVMRVDASNWSSQELCTTPWKSLPQKLKAQLSEHYVE
jgi:DNA-directed RNA polymerase subunit K/omega